jgi:hypothetical protein
MDQPFWLTIVSFVCSFDCRLPSHPFQFYAFGTSHLHRALNQITLTGRIHTSSLDLSVLKTSIDRTNFSPTFSTCIASQSQQHHRILPSLLYTSIIFHCISSKAPPQTPTQNSAVLWLNLAIDEAQSSSIPNHSNAHTKIRRTLTTHHPCMAHPPNPLSTIKLALLELRQPRIFSF